MYRFLLRPRWIAFHLLVLGAIVLMVNLGFWQLRRLDERREFNAVVSERIAQPPTDLDELLASTPPEQLDELEWRQVTTAGDWIDGQVVWFNRSQDGLAGDNVLSALVEVSGPTVVVNRGFVALGTEVPEPPEGGVEVLARVRLPHERQRGELTDSADGPVTEVRRVDLDQLAAQLPGEVAPVYLDLVATDPAVTDADPAPVPMPELNEGPHLSYAMQWFIFSACVAIGWVLAVRRSLTTRRAGPAAPAAPAAVSDAPVPPCDGTVRSRSGSDVPGRASGTPSPR